MLEVILKRFEKPDEVRTFEKGRFEVVKLGGMMIGRATYEPGWKWSAHVGRGAGAKSCSVEHVGMALSGRATAAMDDGRVIEIQASTLLPAMTVGWWETSRTSRCIFLARKPTPTPRKSNWAASAAAREVFHRSRGLERGKLRLSAFRPSAYLYRTTIYRCGTTSGNYIASRYIRRACALGPGMARVADGPPSPCSPTLPPCAPP